MKEPLDLSEAKRLIERILEFGTFDYLHHAMKRMGERAMDIQDVENVLRAGVPRSAEHHVTGAWRYKVETTRMCVVIEFQSDEEFLVVTAWRKEDKTEGTK